MKITQKAILFFILPFYSVNNNTKYTINVSYGMTSIPKTNIEDKSLTQFYIIKINHVNNSHTIILGHMYGMLVNYPCVYN